MKIADVFGPLGVVLGWGLAMATRYFDEVWFGAKLEITCPLDGNKAEQPDHLYIKFCVRNRRERRIAKNCRAYLVAIYQTSDDGKLASANLIFDTFQLPWAGYDFDARDIPGMVSQYVDLVRFSKHNPGWDFRTKPTFYTSLARLRQYSGTYRFTVVVAGAGALPQTKNIFVKYANDWHNVLVYD